MAGLQTDPGQPVISGSQAASRGRRPPEADDPMVVDKIERPVARCECERPSVVKGDDLGERCFKCGKRPR